MPNCKPTCSTYSLHRHSRARPLCAYFHTFSMLRTRLLVFEGNSVKSDVHFGHFQGLDFYCQWGHLGFKVCMMCRGTSTIITLIIRVTPCFILEKCVKNTMVLDVRARNDFFRLSCSCSKLCDVWGLTLKLIPVLIAWSIGLYNIHKHYL